MVSQAVQELDAALAKYNTTDPAAGSTGGTSVADELDQALRDQGNEPARPGRVDYNLEQDPNLTDKIDTFVLGAYHQYNERPMPQGSRDTIYNAIGMGRTPAECRELIKNIALADRENAAVAGEAKADRMVEKVAYNVPHSLDQGVQLLKNVREVARTGNIDRLGTPAESSPMTKALFPNYEENGAALDRFIEENAPETGAENFVGGTAEMLADPKTWLAGETGAKVGLKAIERILPYVDKIPGVRKAVTTVLESKGDTIPGMLVKSGMKGGGAGAGFQTALEAANDLGGEHDPNAVGNIGAATALGTGLGVGAGALGIPGKIRSEKAVADQEAARTAAKEFFTTDKKPVVRKVAKEPILAEGEAARLGAESPKSETLGEFLASAEKAPVKENLTAGSIPAGRETSSHAPGKSGSIERSSDLADLNMALDSPGVKSEGGRVGGMLERAGESLEGRANAIKERFQARRQASIPGTLPLDGDPATKAGGPMKRVQMTAEDLADVVEYGAIKLANWSVDQARKTVDKAQWVKEMAEELGVRGGKELEKAWKESQLYFSRNYRELLKGKMADGSRIVYETGDVVYHPQTGEPLIVKAVRKKQLGVMRRDGSLIAIEKKQLHSSPIKPDMRYDYVESPRGAIDFARFPEEDASLVGFAGGGLRMQYGFPNKTAPNGKGLGLLHDLFDRPELGRRTAEQAIRDFDDIANNYTHFTRDGDRLILIKKGGKQDLAIMGLIPDGEGNFTMVSHRSIGLNKKIRSGEIFERRAKALTTGSEPSLPQNSADGGFNAQPAAETALGKDFTTSNKSIPQDWQKSKSITSGDSRTQQLLTHLQRRKEKIRQRFSERQMKDSPNPKLDGDPTAKRGVVADAGKLALDIADLGEYVAIRLAEGVLNKADILKEVIRDFGSHYRPHVEKIWREGQRYYLKNRKELADLVKASPKTIPDDDFVLPKDVGLGRRIARHVTSSEAELRRQGAAGTRLAGDMQAQRKAEDMLKGQWRARLEEAMEGLTKEQRILAGEVQEGLKTTGDPKVSAAAEKLKGLLDEVGERAELSALDIRTPGGRSTPFKRRANYFPRVYDLDKLTKAKHRTQALKHMVETGQARNLADADRILEGFLKGHGERRAGNLEYARIVDLPGYEKDPLKAVGKYIDGAARRLTEADTFGKKDEIARNLIEKVRREGGDWRYAQDVFDRMVGVTKEKSRLVDLASKFNIMTKLDLSFITNATQPVNTATKTGVINTLNALLKTYVTDRKGALRFAQKAGAVESPLASGKESGLSIGRIMETELMPFTYVETKNRVSSAVAGKLFAEKLAKKILKNPRNNYAIRQLKSLGVDVERIIAEGRISPEDILGAAYETTKATQFKVDVLDVPLSWKTNIGRLLTQFKSFSFRQTIFVRDEVLKEARHGNILPMLRLIALGVPASFVAQTFRNAITGRSLSDESKSLDVRKLDTYLKAIGTIPTDLVSQGEFLYDTFQNPYASPLKKTIRSTSTLLGPTVGEAGKLMLALSSVGDSKKRNKRLPKGKSPEDPYLELKRMGASEIPFVGEYMKNTAFAYPKDNVGDFTRVIRAIESGNKVALGKALKKYDKKQRTMIFNNAILSVVVNAEKKGDMAARDRALKYVPVSKRRSIKERARREIREQNRAGR